MSGEERYGMEATPENVRPGDVYLGGTHGRTDTRRIVRVYDGGVSFVDKEDHDLGCSGDHVTFHQFNNKFVDSHPSAVILRTVGGDGKLELEVVAVSQKLHEVLSGTS